MSEHTGSTPPCESECKTLLVAEFVKDGIEAHVTHVPPLVPPRYEMLDLRCPHGVLWFAEPTSEQIAVWAEAGVG